MKQSERRMIMSYTKATIDKINADITNHFPHLYPIEDNFQLIHYGVSRLVMLDRYAQKDRTLKTLGVGDVVVTIVKEDPKFPARGIGIVRGIDSDKEIAQSNWKRNGAHRSKMRRKRQQA